MTLPVWVKPETSFAEHSNLWHIRGIIDDRAVCRRWIKEKKSWYYAVLDEWFFEAYKEVLRPRT